MEGKEALYRLDNDVKRGNCDYNITPYVNIIDKDLDRLEKQDKILDLIKKRPDHMGLIKNSKDYYDYLSNRNSTINTYWYSQMEYNLLKEELESGN